MDEVEKRIAEAVANNRSFRTEMFEAIGTEETLSFVGAGLSAKLHYPDWNGLIAALTVRANQLGQFVPTADDILSVAEEIKEHFVGLDQLGEYYAILTRTFDNHHLRCSDSHRKLARLPFRSFITTNYDPCLEHGLCSYAFEKKVLGRPDYGFTVAAEDQNRAVISKFLRSLSSKFDPLDRSVAHIHGRHSEPQSIILTLADYEKAYGISLRQRESSVPNAFAIHRQLMWSVLATRRLIFIGCSMSDPYVTTLLKVVTKDLWEWEMGNHFVILGVDRTNINSIADLTRNYGRYGIAPVFFDNFDESYGQLDTLLEEARGYCRADDILDEPTVVLSPGSTTPTPSVVVRPEQTPVLASEWVEGLGERTYKDILNNED